MRKHRSINRRRKRPSKRTLILVIIAVIVVLAAFVVAFILERDAKKPETRGDYTLRQSSEPTVTVNGETYRARKNLTSILFMGIDRDSTAENGMTNRNGGQADFLRLVVIDDTEKTVTQLAIDRDTLTPITILGVLGNRSGTRTERISLSHGFGDGKEQSCELTTEAVSNLLCGVDIDYYVALNLDGIGTLNDEVGGVTVTIEDDFSHLDPEMTVGATICLNGQQAEYFVRSRMSIGVGTNESRMKRQQVYLDKLTELLKEKISENKNYTGTLYDVLSPYLTTNLSRGRMINEASAVQKYTWKDAPEIPGEHRIDEDGFMEFTADQDALTECVLELFYEKV